MHVVHGHAWIAAIEADRVNPARVTSLTCRIPAGESAHRVARHARRLCRHALLRDVVAVGVSEAVGCRDSRLVVVNCTLVVEDDECGIYPRIL